MKVLHPDPCPTALRALAARLAHPLAVLALAPLLLASSTDTVTANCPGLERAEVLTVAAAGNPCAAQAGESAALLALRVVPTRRRPATGGGR